MAEKITKTVKAEEELTWKDLEIGFYLTEPGTATRFRTGDWASHRPVMDKSKCHPKCALCYIYCPDGCIAKMPDGYWEADYYYCKGCGICAEECPWKAITMVEE